WPALLICRPTGREIPPVSGRSIPLSQRKISPLVPAPPCQTTCPALLNAGRLYSEVLAASRLTPAWAAGSAAIATHQSSARTQAEAKSRDRRALLPEPSTGVPRDADTRSLPGSISLAIFIVN